MNEEGEKLTSEIFITMDVCAQNDIECGLVNPMDHFWDVYILRTKMGQMIITMMTVDSDPLSKNMLLQLPIVF